MAVHRALPTLTASGSAVVQPSRANQDLSAYVQPIGSGNWTFADEGSYIVVNNATLATGIAGHAAPVVADTSTKPLFFLYNGTAKSVIMDYLFLEVTAAGTAGTIHYTTIYTDNAGATARSSGGTQITAFDNANSAGGVDTTGLVCYFGAVVAAFTSAKKVGQQIVREVIPVVQDTVTMKFGGPNSGFHSALTTAGTATNHCVQHFAPLVVAPGGNLGIAQIRPSQSAAASYQFSAGFALR
jgi:hypothetical protein